MQLAELLRQSAVVRACRAILEVNAYRVTAQSDDWCFLNATYLSLYFCIQRNRSRDICLY